MKISETIKQLESHMKTHGDIPVRFTMTESSDPEHGDSHLVAGAVTLCNADDTPDYLLLCDVTALEAFAGVNEI